MQSEQEDAELIAQYLKTRDPALQEQIVLRYISLVHYVLGRLGISQHSSVEYEDAVSQGLLGMLDALNRYDPSFGTTFSTYATLRIRGHVLDYLRSLDWLSRTARQRTRAVQDAMGKLWLQLNRAPSDDELAQHLNLDKDQLQQALVDSSRMIISLDSIIDGDESDEYSLYDVLADEDQPNPADVLGEKDLQQALIEALKQLPEREQLLLSLYYFEELTLKEIGAVLGISESRVSQLHARAVMTLRAMLASYAHAPSESEEEDVLSGSWLE